MEEWPAPAELPAEIDITRPHTARMYDYYLGGKNHFAADRELGDRLLKAMPGARTAVRENRMFLGRAVEFLTAEAGVRQFLDIGTGLPAANSVHEVAQRIEPSARVVYADNDPLVLAHARALLTSSPTGKTAYIHADLREPESILASPAVREVLDLSQPVALMLVSILHFIADEEQPAEIVATLLDALSPGSYLVASHGTTEHDEAQGAAGKGAYQSSGVTMATRDSGDFARLAFAGLELVPPGVVLVSEWRRPAGAPAPLARDVGIYGGIGRKP